MKLSFAILLVLVLLAAEGHSRKRYSQRSERDMEKKESFIGGMIKDIKEAFGGKTESLPRNTRIEYGTPPKESLTLGYKFRKGLNGFVNLACILIFCAVSALVYKLATILPQLFRKIRRIFLNPTENNIQIVSLPQERNCTTRRQTLNPESKEGKK